MMGIEDRGHQCYRTHPGSDHHPVEGCCISRTGDVGCQVWEKVGGTRTEKVPWQGSCGSANKALQVLSSQENLFCLGHNSLFLEETSVGLESFPPEGGSRNSNAPSPTALSRCDCKENKLLGFCPCPQEPCPQSTFLNVGSVSSQEHDSQNIFLHVWFPTRQFLCQGQYFSTDGKVTA